jgi:DNA-binding transcriptional MerR regulator
MVKEGRVMRMQKKQFRIGELAQRLEVEKFVIRFWEKEFGVSTNRSDGGQRFYSEEDLSTFQHIKSLLYEQGFTIAGARKLLSDPTSKPSDIIASHRTTMESDNAQQITESLLELRNQLVKLNKLL